MKKSLLLVMLLACISFIGNSISAQGQMVGTAYYKAGSGDFHFSSSMTKEVYGFTNISPIVSNIRFGSTSLQFTIYNEFMETIVGMSRPNGYFDMGVLYIEGYGERRTGFIRLYITY